MGHVQLTLIILIFVAVPPSHGQLFTNEDNPPLIDKILQVIWEPSSLIRMWVGLDQLYNIALSWRSVAKKLASLPFGEGRSMDHVKIQEPRSFKYRKPSVASQWDRFNEIYSSSNLLPIVVDTRNRLIYAQQSNKFLGNNLQTAENYAHKTFQREIPNSASFGLPPSFFFQTQGEFSNTGSMDFLKSANEIGHSLPFVHDPAIVAKLLLDLQKRGNQRILQEKRFPNQFENDPALVAKLLLDFQNRENQRILQEKLFLNQFSGLGSPIPQQLSDTSGFLNGGPQERLNMFLKLMKTLRDIHANDIRRKSLETIES